MTPEIIEAIEALAELDNDTLLGCLSDSQQQVKADKAHKYTPEHFAICVAACDRAQQMIDQRSEQTQVEGPKPLYIAPVNDPEIDPPQRLGRPRRPTHR